MKQENQTNPSKRKPPLNPYLKYSGIGFQMMATIIICLLLGQQADKYFQTEQPLWTLGLMLLGIFASIYQVINSLKE